MNKPKKVETDLHLKPMILMDKTIEMNKLNKIWSPKYIKP
jgi:hypothetical protein